MKAVPILRDYFDKMPALRYLVLCVKSLLSRHNLNTASSSGLSSYGVILLAISFLQLNPLKRPAAYLEQPMQNESLGVLLTDFLDYYGNLFDYAGSVVSVSQGKVLSKAEKGWDGLKNRQSLCVECMLNPGTTCIRRGTKVWWLKLHFQRTMLADRRARSGGSARSSRKRIIFWTRTPFRTYPLHTTFSGESSGSRML